MTSDQSETGAGAAPAPVCYRHPNRETWVSCARCERPICPDCMKPASVGFQCPECVSDGARTVRTARTAFGGHLDGEQGLVTRALVAINVAMFLATVTFGLLQGGIDNAMRILTGGISELHVWLGMPPGRVFEAATPGEYWRFITSGFLHFGVLHLVLNMWALVVFGREVERMVGRWRFLALYLLACLGGSVAVFFWADPTRTSITAGASGAIFGLFGAMLVFFRRLKLDPRQLLVLIAINFGFTIFARDVISWQAHLGGFVIGALVAVVLAYAPRGENRSAVQIGGLVLVAAALMGAVALGTVALGI